ncbi:MAG: nitrate reductase cytochrome c-type subunit [Gammaproteobacteria bacterium]|nr:nitrate reductase cytochrome c-type subunit [Gammaproteobacteria bacterium]
MKKLVIGLMILPLLTITTQANDGIATLRKGEALSVETMPPVIPKVLDTDIRRKRNYPMQPPTIPHKINNYQVDLNTNKCLSCHKRSRVEDSKAPMVSVTHFMDRDGNFLATVSPRRYFCLQCHAIQTDVKLLIDNDFVDMDQLLKRPTK